MDSNGYSNKLGLNRENVTFVSGNMLRDEKLSESFPRQFNDTVVFHYDINAINRHGIHSYDRDQSLDIMACAEEISIVLLAPSQDILINQMVNSERKDGSLSSYHTDLQKHYNSLEWLRLLHLDWLDFLRKYKQSLNTFKFYECNSSSNLLQLMPGIDSLKIHIEKQYSEC
jgi:hypothetical protein